MKGIVFTEFLEMVEARFSPELADRIIEAARLPSGGAYTAVGTYDHAEMWSLVVELSKALDTPVPQVLRAYGEHLSERFAAGYPSFFRAQASVFDFLEGLDSVIHREVRKLYADAELPHFEVVERTPKQMILLYESPRHFADLAEGLIAGCAAYYRQKVDIARETLPAQAGSCVRFTLRLQ